MQHTGPMLESLLRRLSECPPEFVESCAGTSGAQQIAAIICDHFREFGERNPIQRKEDFLDLLVTSLKSAANSRYRALLGVATWLLHDCWFLERPDLAEQAWHWLKMDALRKLSAIVSPNQFVADPDRREELVRLCLNALELRPEGESISQARDRLTTLDSVERQRVVGATAAAERRAREIREAMARKKALESASRYGE